MFLRLLATWLPLIVAGLGGKCGQTGASTGMKYTRLFANLCNAGVGPGSPGADTDVTSMCCVMGLTGRLSAVSGDARDFSGLEPELVGTASQGCL